MSSELRSLPFNLYRTQCLYDSAHSVIYVEVMRSVLHLSYSTPSVIIFLQSHILVHVYLFLCIVSCFLANNGYMKPPVAALGHMVEIFFF